MMLFRLAICVVVAATALHQASAQQTAGDLSVKDAIERLRDPAAILEEGIRRRAAGQHDDALDLFEEAAERGYAPAMVALARLYDPVTFEPGKPFSFPNPRLAAKLYRDAARLGYAGVTEPRSGLKAWLEDHSIRDTVAADLLEEFWK